LIFLVEEMAQEPWEGCCEHSWRSWEFMDSLIVTFPIQPCIGSLEGNGKAWESVWQRRGIPFLSLYRLRGRRLADWNCCWSRTWVWGG
jgi:hypothetical protein